MKISFSANRSIGAAAAALAGLGGAFAAVMEVERLDIGPDYTTDPAFLSQSLSNGERFDLFMPIEGTYYNCEKEDFPDLKDLCFPYCGQVYPVDKLGTRNITVYIPSSYEDGDEAALHLDLEGTDGMVNNVNLTLWDGNVIDSNKFMVNMIDSLMDSEDVPPFVYVAMGLAGPGGPSAFLFGPDNCADGVGTPRMYELCPVSDEYPNFIENKVLPWVANHPKIKDKYPNFKFTMDPAARVVQGQSNGGAMAVKIAFLKPDLFGTAVGFSPALVQQGYNLTSDDVHPLNNAELWVPEPEGQALIANAPYGGGRYYLNVNDRDVGRRPDMCIGGYPAEIPSDPPPTRYNDFVEGNNMTAMALAEKGYEVRFVYGLGACHTDMRVTFAEYPNAIIWAWSAWKEKLEAMDSKNGTGAVTGGDDGSDSNAQDSSGTATGGDDENSGGVAAAAALVLGTSAFVASIIFI